MLKKRIIPILLFQNRKLVKTLQFSSPRIVGDPVRAAGVYADQSADELILLNIDSSDEDYKYFLETTRRVSQRAMVPLSVGGHINTLTRAYEAFAAGADKVVINSEAGRLRKFLSSLANTFGSQAVIGSVDFRVTGAISSVLTNRASLDLNIEVAQYARQLVEAGAGEILLQSVDRDGTRKGLDRETNSSVTSALEVPTILAGGVGNFQHILEGFEDGAEAVACGSLFNFGDNDPQRAKAYLRNHGVALRGEFRSPSGWGGDDSREA